ncbi:MAG: OmpA family protein [Deltaproteobacteria bacterium]|nr:OmpA family protein [Deltaproteobacteria bacterium]
MEKKSFYQQVTTNRSYQIGLGAIVVLAIIVVALAIHSSSVASELEELANEKQQVLIALEDSKKNIESINATRSSEKVKFTETEQTLQETQQALEEQVAELESALQNVKSTVGDLKAEKREAMIELAQFKRFSGQFQRMINAGKLEVVFRQGRMVVNLPAQVLFDSGSAQLTEGGLSSLKEVAKILRTVKNKRFVVGGHTDNRKISKADFDSNWELASARAINVTEELVKAGLPPRNLIAAGYSQYAPIASNATEAGRKKNRRIEIILEPFLKDIAPPRAQTAKNKTAAKKAGKSKKKSLKS